MLIMHTAFRLFSHHIYLSIYLTVVSGDIFVAVVVLKCTVRAAAHEH